MKKVISISPIDFIKIIGTKEPQGYDCSQMTIVTIVHK